ncbi:MAG: sigma-70 family RNA polymerase sigma factor [Cytophagales bacterium]|nr:sigma-70 family RNA polymerase sigma factor [Cytophagales bacterium]MBQ5918985.1 sigma-70 family RNA polymerase sigma factor [Lachnospiraceae bacterium]
MITNKDIKQYKNLVYKIVNKYRGRTFKYKTNIDWDEMEHVGMIALYNALKNFNPDKDASFLNYASTAIWRAIVRQEKFDRKLEEEIDIEELMYGLSDDSMEDMDEKISNELVFNKVLKMIKTAPILQRSKDITIARLLGATNAELGERYNTSPQNISKIYLRVIHRIIDKIQGGKNADRE